MYYQEFKEKIIIKGIDGTANNIIFRMYFQPHINPGCEYDGWIGEKSYTREELMSEKDPNGVLDPYKDVWFALNQDISNYYMRNFVKGWVKTK